METPDIEVIIKGLPNAGKSVLLMNIARLLQESGVKDVHVCDDDLPIALIAKPGAEVLKDKRILIITDRGFVTGGKDQIPGIRSPSPFPPPTPTPLKKLYATAQKAKTERERAIKRAAASRAKKA